MKCPYCGSAIGIEDEKCPYCGRVNEFAKKHVKDMKRYKKEFERTKLEVTENTQKMSKLTAPIIVIAVLLILDVAALVFMIGADNIGREIVKNRVEQNQEEYVTALTKFKEEKDFIGLGVYYDVNDLYFADSFKSYGPAQYTCDSLSHIFRILVPGGNSIYDREELERSAKNIADDLETIYGIENQYSFDHDLYFSPDKMEIIEGVREQTKGLFLAYGGFTEEEYEGFLGLSKKNQQSMLIEKLEWRLSDE